MGQEEVQHLPDLKSVKQFIEQPHPVFGTGRLMASHDKQYFVKQVGSDCKQTTMKLLRTAEVIGKEERLVRALLLGVEKQHFVCSESALLKVGYQCHSASLRDQIQHSRQLGRSYSQAESRSIILFLAELLLALSQQREVAAFVSSDRVMCSPSRSYKLLHFLQSQHQTRQRLSQLLEREKLFLPPHLLQQLHVLELSHQNVQQGNLYSLAMVLLQLAGGDPESHSSPVRQRQFIGEAQKTISTQLGKELARLFSMLVQSHSGVKTYRELVDYLLPGPSQAVDYQPQFKQSLFRQTPSLQAVPRKQQTIKEGKTDLRISGLSSSKDKKATPLIKKQQSSRRDPERTKQDALLKSLGKAKREREQRLVVQFFRPQ